VIPWHVEFEVTHAGTKAEAEAIAFAMLGGHQGVRLLKVQSTVSRDIGRDEWAARRKTRACDDDDDGA
jgi:hypothetical protein